MEKLIHNYGCSFLKLRCRCLSFTKFGFRQQAHRRFVAKTGLCVTPSTAINNTSCGLKQLHTSLTSLLCCRN